MTVWLFRPTEKALIKKHNKRAKLKKQEKIYFF
jgi:hypothetical protein